LPLCNPVVSSMTRDCMLCAPSHIMYEDIIVTHLYIKDLDFMIVFRTKAESMNPAAAAAMAISWNRMKSLENMEQLCKSSLQYLMISTNWIELDEPTC